MKVARKKRGAPTPSFVNLGSDFFCHVSAGCRGRREEGGEGKRKGGSPFLILQGSVACVAPSQSKQGEAQQGGGGGLFIPYVHWGLSGRQRMFCKRRSTKKQEERDICPRNDSRTTKQIRAISKLPIRLGLLT